LNGNIIEKRKKTKKREKGTNTKKNKQHGSNGNDE
jgi:hypothetical protein